MRYYYIDEQQQTAGPVEETSLYEALHLGTVSTQTPVAVEGGEEWQALAAVLPYYFSLGSETLGPLPLAKLANVAASSTEPVMIVEPGGSEWRPLSSLLPGPALMPPELPRVLASPYAPPASAISLLKRQKRPSFPGGVKAAGIIWIIYGTVRLAAAVVAVIILRGLNHAGFLAIGVGIPLFVGVVFLRIGIQTCKGTVPDVRSNGMGSIGIGILLFGMNYWLQRDGREINSTELLVDAAINATLVAAGICALMSRAAFLAWKEYGIPVKVRATRR